MTRPGARTIADIEEQMRLDHPVAYERWVDGSGTAGRVFFVLGMHRSGTSCLTACLERSGVHLGEVVRHSVAQPRGNLELDRVIEINDRMFRAAGGSWSSPPSEPVRPAPDDLAAIADVVAGLERHGPSAVKDPRIVLTSEAWLGAARAPAIMGTFRHPRAVSTSLAQRDDLVEASATRLWCRYNERLVDLHRRHPFPLVEFDLTDREAYVRSVAAVAAEAGLQPDLAAIRSVVRQEHAPQQVSRDVSVPDECAALYDYLRRHRATGDLAAGSFAALVVERGELVGTWPSPARWQELERRAWFATRHLPSGIRRLLGPAARLRQRLVRRSGSGRPQRRP